jgi:transketolase
VRNVFCAALVRHAGRPDFVFLTGDLGYMALEPLQRAAGERFINAGIAEQNMVSVAAGLARQGLRPFAYSIAPFIYARPLEQIRNDLCLHDLPVTLVGNGGGYAYGVMGATHHAIEDYGVLLALQNMRAFVPAFGADIDPIVTKLLSGTHPAYLRLARDEKPKELEVPTYAPWRRLTLGGGPALVVVGPFAGAILGRLLELDAAKRPNTWLVTELPTRIGDIPAEFLEDLRQSGHLVVAEEHVAHGGAAEMLCRELLVAGHVPRRLTHLCAQGYPSGRYGSQQYHRAESGITFDSLLKALE